MFSQGHLIITLDVQFYNRHTCFAFMFVQFCTISKYYVRIDGHPANNGTASPHVIHQLGGQNEEGTSLKHNIPITGNTHRGPRCDRSRNKLSYILVLDV